MGIKQKGRKNNYHYAEISKWESTIVGKTSLSTITIINAALQPATAFAIIAKFIPSSECG